MWLRTLTAHVRSQALSGTSTPPSTMIPALAQNRSTGPKVRSVCSTNPMTSPSSATSTVAASAAWPAAFSSSATASAPLPSMSATATPSAPWAAKVRHRARPIPLAPPVTTTTRSLTSMAEGSDPGAGPGGGEDRAALRDGGARWSGIGHRSLQEVGGRPSPAAAGHRGGRIHGRPTYPSISDDAEKSLVTGGVIGRRGPGNGSVGGTGDGPGEPVGAGRRPVGSPGSRPVSFGQAELGRDQCVRAGGDCGSESSVPAGRRTNGRVDRSSSMSGVRLGGGPQADRPRFRGWPAMTRASSAVAAAMSGRTPDSARRADRYLRALAPRHHADGSQPSTRSSRDWPVTANIVSSSDWRHNSSSPTDSGSQP